MTCVPTGEAPPPEAPAPDPEPEQPQQAPSAWRSIHTRGSRRSRRTQAAAPPPPPPPEPIQSWATWQRECLSPYALGGRHADCFVPYSGPCAGAVSSDDLCGAPPCAAPGQPRVVRPTLPSRLHPPVIDWVWRTFRTVLFLLIIPPLRATT